MTSTTIPPRIASPRPPARPRAVRAAGACSVAVQQAEAGLPRGAADGRAATRALLLVAAVALLAQCMALLRAVGGEFVSDDERVAGTASPLARVPLAEPWRLLLPRDGSWEYLPVRDLSLRLDIALFGDWTPGYHLHNLALYALLCWLVFAVTRRIVALLGERGTDATAVAAVTATVFAVHPAHVEAVAWIAGRRDLLAGLFGVLAVLAWLRVLAGGRGAAGWYAASALALLAALLSKASALPLPALMAALWLAHRQPAAGGVRALGGAMAATAPMLALGVAVTAVNLLAGDAAGASRTGELVAPGAAAVLERAALVLGHLVRIALLPVDLRLTYDIYADGARLPALLLAALALAACVAGWLRLLRRPGVAAIGLALFVPLTVPFLQLVPFFSSSMAAERFVFLPVWMLGLVLAAAWSRLPARAGVAGLALLAAAGVGISADRAGDWRSFETLVAVERERTPGYCYTAYQGILAVQRAGGDFEQARAVARDATDPDFHAALTAYVDAAEATWALRAGRLRAPRAARPVLALDDALRRIAARPARDMTCQMARAYLEHPLIDFYRLLLPRLPGDARIALRLGVLLARNDLAAPAATLLERALASGMLDEPAAAEARRVLARLRGAPD